MAAHIYWRIRFTEPPDGKRSTNISRLELHPIPNGINLCLPGNGYISASSESPPEKNDTFVAYNALNNNSRADWMSVVESVSWLKYEFVTPQEVQEILFSASNDKNYILNAPQDFELQWSNDDINWTTSFSIVGEINWAKGETRVFSTDAKIDTIGRGYTHYTADPVTPFTDHLLAIEKEGALSISVHRDKVTPLTEANYLSSAQQLDIISTQYVSLGVAAEKNEAVKVTVKVTVVLIVPTTQTSAALPFTFKKVRCLIGDKSYAYPFTVKFTKKTDECACAYTVIPRKFVIQPFLSASESDESYPVEHSRRTLIALAQERSSSQVIKRGVIDVDLSIAGNSDTAQLIAPDKEPDFFPALTIEGASSLTLAWSRLIGIAGESDAANKVSVSLYESIFSASNKDSAFQFSSAKDVGFDAATVYSSAIAVLPVRTPIIHQATERDTSSQSRPTRPIHVVTAESKSSAAVVEYALSAQIGIAEELSSSPSLVILQDKLIDLIPAYEQDLATNYFRCPIHEKDHAYSVQLFYPYIINRVDSLDSAVSINPVKRGWIAPPVTSEENAYSINPTYVVSLGISTSDETAESIGAEKDSSFSEAISKETASQTSIERGIDLGIAAEKPSALRTFPPFSGTLGVVATTNSASVLSGSKDQAFAAASEKDTAFTLDTAFAYTLGQVIEGDIVQFQTAIHKAFFLNFVERKSSGYPVTPKSDYPIGQAVSNEVGRSLPRDRYVQLVPADSRSSALFVSIHEANRFNKAIEGDVARYITVIRTKALQIASEQDATFALHNALKARGINLGTEEDAALVLRSAFAYEIGTAEEKSAANSLSHMRSIILGFSSDGGFAYTLDRWLKEQELGQVVEEDVATVSVANLTKEIKRALEYNDAQEQAAGRALFLSQVATNETAYALGQSMKYKLIRQAASSTDAPYLNGEQPWRNKWQASSSIQEDIEFSLSMQQDFEGVVSLQQDIEFVVALQDDKQFIEEI